MALFARALLIKVFPDIRMIPLSGFPVPEEFASIDPEDAVLPLASAGGPPMFRNVIGSSRRAGAKCPGDEFASRRATSAVPI